MSYCELFQEKKVHIRKDTRCYGCAKKFPKGRVLWAQQGLYDGRFFYNHLCSPCRKEAYDTVEDDEEYGYGDLRDRRVDRARVWAHDRKMKPSGAEDGVRL